MSISVKKSPDIQFINCLLCIALVTLLSACGGGGTCAQCICQVHSGGGQILTTELNHISRKDAQNNWRLACQVKVRNDMDIKVSDEILSIQKWECTVRSNDNVATFIKELILLPSILFQFGLSFYFIFKIIKEKKIRLIMILNFVFTLLIMYSFVYV